jgi:hypothetical protein
MAGNEERNTIQEECTACKSQSTNENVIKWGEAQQFKKQTEDRELGL